MGQTPYLDALSTWLGHAAAQHANHSCAAAPQWQIDDRCLRQPTSWIGPRLIAWPATLASSRWIGVVSSRIGRQLDQHPQWFTGLRYVCDHLEQDDVMISADNTTTGRFLDRCRWLWKVPVVKLQQAPITMPLVEWFARLADTPCDDRDSIRWLLSPPLNPNVLPASLTQIPLADRAVAYLSDHLHVLHLRRNGHWHHLLRSRLSEPALPANTVYFSSHSMPPKLANELVSLRALESQPNIPAASADAAQPNPPTTHPLVTAMPAIGSYLIHCTRRCDGPWPGQSEADYYDSLLLGLPSSHRSALAVLTRIVCQRRLLASAVTNRAGRRAVSFTAVPLPKLPALRKFRPHRARWDFEPYGIGIKRSWLTRRGTKPVIYGEDACWNQLSESEQPFFQKSRSDGKSPVDWTSEKEWRHLGDVDLQSLPHHAAFVFVPDYQAAVQLAPRSPWPVFILNPTHGPQQLQGP